MVMLKILAKFKERNFLFDFCYLFIGLLFVNGIILGSVYCFSGESLFDEEDLRYLTINKLITYILLFPLIEEFAFRGIFSLKNRYYLFFSWLSNLIVVFVIFKNVWFLIFYSLFLSFSCLILMFKNREMERFRKFVQKYFVHLLVFTSLAFGLMHLSNYDQINLQTFLKVLPRIISGFYLGYIAKKYGIFYSYIMHGVNNIIPFIFLLYQKFKF
ncbi:CPBP family glutamic-type intramembrane protease [Ornithobacterium rhinotracheale]|uniref:CPBP family glutamic-type intramembrane protease n=2 Tax=Ornithobacterium rhinotracheale TaxID=28251 RepID=UPI004036BA55